MTGFQPKLISAAALPYERLAFLVNQAYIDYYIPIWLDEKQFQQMCYIEDVDLRRSVVAVIDNEPVGLALLSAREREGWISAVGVLPTWRRQGVGHEIVQQVQRVARHSGLACLRLEVLTQNEAGAALYRNLGFTWQRDLLVLTLEPPQVDLQPWPKTITEVSPAEMLSHYDAFHDVRAPWQRALPSLQHQARDLRGLGFRDQGHLLGYVLYRPQRNRYAIFDIAVLPPHPHRVTVAQALLRALHQQRSDTSSYIINFPADDPLVPALTGLRFRIWQRQYEMVWTASDIL